MNTNFSPLPILKTDRLLLRKLNIEDSPLIFNYQKNPDNYPFVNMAKYTDISQAIEYIEKMNKGVENNKWIVWAITNKKSNDIIGTISLWNINHTNYTAELGYGLYPGNLKKGFMSEALKRVCEYGFSEMGLLRIGAYTNEINKPSRKLLEKNGFQTDSSIIEDNTKLVIYHKENTRMIL